MVITLETSKGVGNMAKNQLIFQSKKKIQINILGTRGIPAAHGGFESFTARLAPWLRDQGHEVNVYCQEEGGVTGPWEDTWQGIRRIHIRPRLGGPAGTVEFDFACVRDVLKRPGIDLVLGYNTAVFGILQRLRGRRVVMNMDGIEWKRAKWSLPAKVWFFANEVIGVNICNLAVADHPEIAAHLSKRCFKSPVMIPYGADEITSATEEPVRKLGLQPGRYFISIARIEPENSIFEMVRAFSTLCTQIKCVILGKFDPNNSYHNAVKAIAGPNVVFPGAIYDQAIVRSLRYHARCNLHGHQVGGTNPSLVEALGAGNAVLAHNNQFNRWTAGEGQFFFADELEAASQMRIIIDSYNAHASASAAARARFAIDFRWESVLKAYEDVLMQAAR